MRTSTTAPSGSPAEGADRGTGQAAHRTVPGY
jgi:hypothetical protein